MFSIYLIFFYIGGSLLCSLLCHKYIKAWIMGLYGQLPLSLMQEDEQLSQKVKSRGIGQNLEAIPEEQPEDQAESSSNVSDQVDEEEQMRVVKTKLTRPILDEDLLDTEDKRLFIAKMNFPIKVPRLLVRIHHTYYTKLSTFLKQ